MTFSKIRKIVCGMENKINVNKSAQLQVADSLLGLIPLFVYGTLKRGHGNHRFLANELFIGEASSVSNMILFEEFGLPYLRKGTLNVGKKIKGEVYGITDLSSIDRLEGEPFHYRASLLPFKVEHPDDENGVVLNCRCYLQTNQDIPVSEDKMLEEWSHRMKY